MKFSLVADTLRYMENTTKRLELTQHLVDLFKITPSDIIPKVVYLLQGKLRPDHEGVEIGIAEKIAIRALSKSSGISVKKIDHEYKETGDFGQVASKILGQKTQTTFLSEDITVERVYDTLYKIAELRGARSQDMKMKYISSLLNDATPEEGRFIAKIITSNLRLGIADFTILDALSIAYTGSKENRPFLEHAYNVCSDLGKVAQAVSTGGINSLNDFQVTIFNPIRPMLAERVKSPQEAHEKMGNPRNIFSFSGYDIICSSSFNGLKYRETSTTRTVLLRKNSYVPNLISNKWHAIISEISYYNGTRLPGLKRFSIPNYLHNQCIQVHMKALMLLAFTSNQAHFFTSVAISDLDFKHFFNGFSLVRMKNHCCANDPLRPRGIPTLFFQNF